MDTEPTTVLGQPFPQTHPNRLAAIATLFGMQAPDVKRCRVLELGCSDGANLVPMAVQYPKSEFVGVDLSEHKTAEGKKTIRELKLKNIKIECQNILDINPKNLEKFDYIIVHNIYSWVPAEVCQKILQICREQLTPNGVAYVSYNTYPGWHMRGMLRDMMQFHVRQLKDPKQKVQQAHALINFLATSVPTENSPYGMLLKNELAQMQRWPDYYFYHDSLEKTNEPVYFHQFIEAAMQEGMQYLGEADLASMVVQNFPQPIKETLQKIAPNIVAMEQYMDFLRNRTYRQTLICHQEIKLSRNISSENLQAFYFAAPLKAVAEKPEITSDKVEEFQLPNGAKISANNPIAKAMWQHLATSWPQAVDIKNIITGVKSQIDTKDDIQQPLTELLLQAFMKGAVQCYAHPFEMTMQVSKCPSTTPLARYEAQKRAWVTNQKHEPINIDKLNQNILTQLDGKHDKKDLQKILSSMVDKNEITIAEKGVAVTDKEAAKNILTQQLDTMLTQLAKAGLLVG